MIRFGASDERRIGEDHPVDVEEGAELGRRVAAGHRAVQALELVLHLRERVVEARDLGRRRVAGGNRVVGDLERRVRDELRPPDGDAARDAEPVEREARHGATGPRRSSR